MSDESNNNETKCIIEPKEMLHQKYYGNDDGFCDSQFSPKKVGILLNDEVNSTVFDNGLKEDGEQLFIREPLNVRTLKDSVHGTITMHPLLAAIIDTPQFQRLRDVKQLGFGYWVYPGACHNRFEHCIGTSYLCGLMLSTLRHLHTNVYHDPIEITDKDILCVKIAGLCHDIGHGPFSHVFDGKIIRELQPESGWEHEDGSCDLFDHMIKVNTNVQEIFHKYSIGKHECDTIKRMIRGHVEDEARCHFGGKLYVKQFLYEIVANKSTGIDCDKFDYIARDTHHVGIKNSFDFIRYFQNIRIMPASEENGCNRLCICARDKEEPNLYELFHVRWTLHRQVYQHKTTHAVAEMIFEAVKKVDKKFGISSSIKDMDRYTNMTDSIIYEILRSNDTSVEVKEAQDLIKRVQTRQLYHFCGQFKKKSNLKYDLLKITKDVEDSVGIQPGDTFLSKSYFSFGKKNQNPLSNMCFFDKHGNFSSLTTELSNLVPRAFEEENIRVYYKCKERNIEIERSIRDWCKNNKFQDSDPDQINGY